MRTSIGRVAGVGASEGEAGRDRQPARTGLNTLVNWVAAAAVAVAMSITWGDDQALQATADDLADAIQSAQASALAMGDE